MAKIKSEMQSSLKTNNTCLNFAFKEDLIYNSIKTWFRKSDDAIIKRQYALSYSTWFYRFDVTMMVNTISIGNKLFPSYIHYKGNWHVFGKDAERISCTSALQYP